MNNLFKEFENNINDSFIIFDLETTGLDPNNSEIIEFGALKFKNGLLVDTFHEYVKPNNYIPYYITNINHITNKMVSNCDNIDKVLKRFMNFIKGYKIVGHNIINFDLKFIKNYCKKYDIDYNIFKIEDTLYLTRKKYSFLPNSKLETLKDYFHIKVPSHDAINDCIVTAYVYMKCEYC